MVTDATRQGAAFTCGAVRLPAHPIHRRCRTTRPSSSSAATTASSCRTRASACVGKLASTLAAFVVSISMAPSTSARRANSPGRARSRSRLRSAYTDVEGCRPWADRAARAGYFQAWVDPQALIPDTSRELVDLPIESRGMIATEGYQTPSLPPGRSMGVALRLDPGVQEHGVRAGFELAAQNGADEYSSNNDNDALALSATGFIRMPHDGWLLVSGRRWNPRTVGRPAVSPRSNRPICRRRSALHF